MVTSHSHLEHLVTRVLIRIPSIYAPATQILRAISWEDLGQCSPSGYKEFHGH